MWEMQLRSEAKRSVRPLQEPMRGSGDAGRGGKEAVDVRELGCR